MSSIATALAAVGAATAVAGTAYAISGAGNPNYPATPNLASSSAALSKAQAQLLPLQRGIAAAAQEGGKYTFSLPTGVNGAAYGFNDLPQGSTTTTEQQVFVPGDVTKQQSNAPDLQKGSGSIWDSLNMGGQNGQAPAGKWVTYNPEDFKPGGKYASLPTPQLRNVTNNNGTYTVDFKGFGAADTQGTIAKQSAAGQLALAQKYDPQFIAQALQQEQQADPTGTAARQLEAQLIQKQMGMDFTNPISGKLTSQVDEQVNAGRGLDPMETSALHDSVGRALASRGGDGLGADFSQPLTTGAAGVARQAAGIQKGVGEISSGTTPEDVQYRQQQQNMADLSALITGQTPQSQFHSLSGAQSGPTPMVSGAPLPTSPGNTMGAAGSAALNANATGNQIRNATANPWLAGLSTTINAVGALGNAGVFH